MDSHKLALTTHLEQIQEEFILGHAIILIHFIFSLFIDQLVNTVSIVS